MWLDIVMKDEIIEFLILPFVVVAFAMYSVASYLLLSIFIGFCLVIGLLILISEKLFPLLDNLFKRIPMPDFIDYDSIRSSNQRVFRMKRYIAAVERIKAKYPSLETTSEQFKRAVNKLLKY